MRPEALLDTSTVILLPHLAAAISLPDNCAVSSITLAELAVGPVVAQDASARRRRRAELAAALQTFSVIPFDEAAAFAYPKVVMSRRASGRKASARTTDSLIAAVVMAHGLPLYTCDPADFAGIEGLDVVVVPHPARN